MFNYKDKTEVLHKTHESVIKLLSSEIHEDNKENTKIVLQAYFSASEKAIDLMTTITADLREELRKTRENHKTAEDKARKLGLI